MLCWVPGMQADQNFGVQVIPRHASLHLSDKNHNLDADENTTGQDDRLMPPRLSSSSPCRAGEGK